MKKKEAVKAPDKYPAVLYVHREGEGEELSYMADESLNNKLRYISLEQEQDVAVYHLVSTGRVATTVEVE